MALNINTKLTNNLNGYLLDAKNVKGNFVIIPDSETPETYIPEACLETGMKAYKPYGGDSFNGDWYEYNGSSWELVDNIIMVPLLNEAFDITKTYTYNVAGLELSRQKGIVFYFSDRTVIFFDIYIANGNFGNLSIDICKIMDVNNITYKAKLTSRYDSDEHENVLTLSFQELQAGSGGGGTGTTKKWYEFKFSNTYTDLESALILKIDETQFGQLLNVVNQGGPSLDPDWQNITTKEEFVAFYNSIKTALPSSQVLKQNVTSILMFLSSMAYHNGNIPYLAHDKLSSAITDGYLQNRLIIDSADLSYYDDTTHALKIAYNFDSEQQSYWQVSLNGDSTLTITETVESTGGGSSEGGSQEITIEQNIRVISLNSLYPAPVTVLITQDNLNAFFTAMSSVAGTTINEDNFATIWATLNTTARAQALGVLLTMYKHSIDYDGQPVLKFDSNNLSLYVAEVGSAISGTTAGEYELNCIEIGSKGLTNATVTIAPLQTITISGGSGGGTGSSRTLYHIEVADSNNHKAIIPIYKEAFDKYLVEMNQVGQQMATAMSVTWTTLNTIDDLKNTFNSLKTGSLAYACDLAMNLLVKYAYESGENPVLQLPIQDDVLANNDLTISNIASYDLTTYSPNIILGQVKSIYNNVESSLLEDYVWFKVSPNYSGEQIEINSNATFTYTEEQVSGGGSSEPVSGGSEKLYELSMELTRYDDNGDSVDWIFGTMPMQTDALKLVFNIYESNFEKIKSVLSSLNIIVNTIQDFVSYINNTLNETIADETSSGAKVYQLLTLIELADKCYISANFGTNNFLIEVLGNGVSVAVPVITIKDYNSLVSAPLSFSNGNDDLYYALNVNNSCTLTEYGTSGSGSGGETATKKWYKWVLSTSQDTTQERADSAYHNILNIKMSEDAWNTFKTDWATLLQQYNITQPSDFVTAFDQIKSSGDYTFRGYISQMYVAFGLICEYCIKDNSIPFTNIENDVSSQNGFGIVDRVDGDSAYFRDSNGNTTTLDYSKADKNFFIDQYSTLTVTEETETISGGGSSTPSEVEVIYLGTLNANATNYDQGVNFIAFDITNKLNLSFSDIASEISLQETINKIGNYVFNSTLNVNYSNNNVKSYPLYTKVVSSVVKSHFPNYYATLEINLGNLKQALSYNEFNCAKLYIKYETDDSVEPNTHSVTAIIALYNTEINLQRLYSDTNSNKCAIGCFDSERSKNILIELRDTVETFTDGTNKYLNGGSWYKLERVNNSNVYYQREYYYDVQGVMTITNNNLEIPIILRSNTNEVLQVGVEPERFSIAYNLVVNMNQFQYMAGVASWSGSNNDNIRQFLINGSVAPLDHIQLLLSHLTGNPTYDVYDEDKPTPCFVFCTESNICWKLQYDGETNGLRAYKVVNFPFVVKENRYYWHIMSSNDNELNFWMNESAMQYLINAINTIMPTVNPSWVNITDYNGVVDLFNTLKVNASDPTTFVLITTLLGSGGYVIKDNTLYGEKTPIYFTKIGIDYVETREVTGVRVDPSGNTITYADPFGVLGNSIITNDSSQASDGVYIDSNTALIISKQR